MKNITPSSRGPRKLTEVTCCICGGKRLRPTCLVESYKARGITDHTCGAKPCILKLRSIKIRAVKNTPEALAKISETSKAAWAANHDAHAAACQAGMQASPNYAPALRNAKAADTRKHNREINPTKYSDAIKAGWESRPRQVITAVDFICDHCSTQVHRELKPSKYARFLKSPLHFCDDKCHGQYKHAHVDNTELICPQCQGKFLKRTKLVEHLRRIGQQDFFCNKKCSKIWQLTHFKSEDTIPEQIMRAYLVAENILFKAQQVIELPITFASQRHTLPDFSVGNVLIYVDGCAVHGCDVCGLRGFKNNKAKDPLITAALQSLGYTVIRVMEHELKDPAATWQRRILGVLK